jgi:sulfur-carrier protein
VNADPTLQAADRAAVILLIPGPLQAAAGGVPELRLEASTLKDLLEVLESRHPALHRSICHETGKVRPHVNLFVNTDHMRDREGLDTPLRSGDVVYVLPAVSGG